MKQFLLAFLSLLFLPAFAADKSPEGYPQTDRTKLSLNADWRFHLGDADADFYKTNTNDSQWELVSVPHTLELTDLALNDYQDDKTQPTFMRKVGWYRKDIFVEKSNKKVYIEFEGVHQITTLWVNGKKVGVHNVGGYTPFYYDITSFVKRGAKNQLTVLADNRMSQVAPPDPGPFDYIKFSGLYRDVYLVEKNPMHITNNLESANSGVTITTPSVDYVNGNATVVVHTEVQNESKKAQRATMVQRVVDAQGNVVLKLSETALIPAGGMHRFAQVGGMEKDVKFWSPESPNLYMVNSTLYDESGKALDVVDNRLGLRKVEYDHETGFRINGKNTELIGFNRHQQFAFIGDAVPNSLHYRDMKQLKDLGINTIRTAHYPQDDEIIRACDELGLLLYEEAPTWIGVPREKEWYENLRKATQAMIRNHKNAPSIIIWGAGINHRGPVPEAQFVVKLEDPTRLTASQNSRWTGWQNSSWTDIFGNMNYGPGIWGREEPLLAMEGWYGPEAIAPYLLDPMKPGMISWTAHAYYTFHSFEQDNSMTLRTRLGALDAFRYLKDDMLAWYPAELKVEPYIYVKDDWTKDLSMLTVYSNATEIELLLNGRSIGRYAPSDALKYRGLSHPPYEIKNLPYEDGELKVVGYREGKVIVEKAVFTPTKATRINLIAPQYGVDFLADGNDIVVVHAEVLDKNGMRIRNFDGKVAFSVQSGDATIVGDKEGERFNPMLVRNGVASALVRAGKTVGEIKVAAECDGISSASISLETVPAETDRMVAEAYTIKDKESIFVDLGGEGQILQFGWTAWDCKDGKSASMSILPAKPTNFVAGHTPPATNISELVPAGTEGSYAVSIKTNSANGLLRFLGEMNVIGQNGFVYGDGVLGTDQAGITLRFEDLPTGEYVLTTYHHAPSSNTNEMDPNLERLKQESVHKLPYAKTLSVSVNGTEQLSRVATSAGKEQQYNDAATSTVRFNIEKAGDAADILFKSTDKIPAVWINGFELDRMTK